MTYFKITLVLAFTLCFSTWAHAKTDHAPTLNTEHEKDSVRVTKDIQGLLFFSLPKAEPNEQKDRAPMSLRHECTMEEEA